MDSIIITRDLIKNKIKEYTKGTTIGIIDIDKNVQIFASRIISEKISSIIAKTNYTDAHLQRYYDIMMCMFDQLGKNCIVNSCAFAKFIETCNLQSPIELQKNVKCMYFGICLGKYTSQLWNNTFFINGELNNMWEYNNAENKFLLHTKNKLLHATVINCKIVVYICYEEFEKNKDTNTIIITNDAVTSLFEYCNSLNPVHVPSIHYE
jgi:hypothetical protein